MIETPSLLHYLHLNSSFSDNIGLISGKAGVVLFFSSQSNEYYRTEISYNFLEEILSQISLQTPLSFGHGITGVGCLLEYLRKRKILDFNINELVEDFEPYLLNSVRSRQSSDITLEHGLSGIGLYLLLRYTSGMLSQDYATDVSHLITIILEQVLDSANSPSYSLSDNSLWSGISGVYMFVSHAAQAGLLRNEQLDKANRLISKIMSSISTSAAHWDQLPLWHVLLNCTSIVPSSGHANQIHSLFYQYLAWCTSSKDKIHFTDAAHYASLLSYTAVVKNISECLPIAHRLIDIPRTLSEANDLNVLFPYQENNRSIGMGIAHGASGTALSLHTLNNNDFEWLQVLGYSTAV